MERQYDDSTPLLNRQIRGTTPIPANSGSGKHMNTPIPIDNTERSPHYLDLSQHIKSCFSSFS